MSGNPSSSHPVELRSSAKPTPKVIDLLEVHARQVTWKPRLDHLRLQNHFCQPGDVNHTDRPQLALRILFVQGLSDDESPHELLPAKLDLEFNPGHWMESPFFFPKIRSRQLSGRASASIWKEGKRVTLDGVYRLVYFIEMEQVSTHVWFSHSLIVGNESSTYVITECPENTKQAILSHILIQSENRNIWTPLRPLEIDAYLSEQSLDTFRQNMCFLAHRLTYYEKPSNADLSPTQTATALQILHPLSKSLHVLQAVITDQQEGLEYLCSVHQRLMVLLGDRHELEDAEYTADLFSYIKTQNDMLKRWAINFDERLAMRTNLLFNMSAQSDNRTNLDIAKLTSKIAVTTHVGRQAEQSTD